MPRPGFPYDLRDLAAFKRALAECEVDRQLVLVGDAEAKFSPDRQVAVYLERSASYNRNDARGVHRFIAFAVATGATLLEHFERWSSSGGSYRDRETETSEFDPGIESDRVARWSVTDDGLLLEFETASTCQPPRHHVNPVHVPIPRVPVPRVPSVTPPSPRGIARFPDLAAFLQAVATGSIAAQQCVIGATGQACFTRDRRRVVYSESTVSGAYMGDKYGVDRFVVFDVATGAAVLEHVERWTVRNFSNRDAESETNNFQSIASDRVDAWTLTDDGIVLTFVQRGEVVIPFPKP